MTESRQQKTETEKTEIGEERRKRGNRYGSRRDLIKEEIRNFREWGLGDWLKNRKRRRVRWLKEIRM